MRASRPVVIVLVLIVGLGSILTGAADDGTTKIGSFVRFGMSESLTEEDVTTTSDGIMVHSPPLASELRIDVTYLNEVLGEWSADAPYALADDGRVVVSGEDTEFRRFSLGEQSVFSSGATASVHLMDRPMWISFTQDGVGRPITLNLTDGDTTGQRVMVNKDWLGSRGIVDPIVRHEDGTPIDVDPRTGESAYLLNVDHFSYVRITDSGVVKGQLGSGPIMEHSGEVRWDEPNLTLDIYVDSKLLPYTVYLNKSWADGKMPEPVGVGRDWTISAIDGSHYYEITLAEDETPTILIVESSINVWRRTLEGGGLLEFASDNVTITIPVNVSTSFVSVNESLVPTDDPDESPMMQVLRGLDNETGATAAVILRPDRVAAIVNYEGTYQVNIPEITVREPAGNATPPADRHEGASIHLSKHIWDTATPGEPKDPLNVIYYDGGIEWTVNHVLTQAGWDEGACGSTKQTYFADRFHGGSSGWQTEQAEDYQDSGFCFTNRYHLRTFYSETGDTHFPGYGFYAAAPVHWEQGFAHSDVYPQQGQDYLLSQMSDSDWVHHMWFLLVPTADHDCDSCDEWDGWIDIYGLVYEFDDPCGQPRWSSASVYDTERERRYTLHDYTCAGPGVQMVANITPLPL